MNWMNFKGEDMIKGLRVDYRLIHGQVAFSYIAKLGADCILLASDTLLNDALRLETVKLTRPQNVKVVAKNVEDSITAIKSGVTDKYKLLIICENIRDAYRLATAVDPESVNLGGTNENEGKKHLGQAVYADTGEIELLKEMIHKGIYCFVQGAASDKEIDVSKVI